MTFFAKLLILYICTYAAFLASEFISYDKVFLALLVSKIALDLGLLRNNGK